MAGNTTACDSAVVRIVQILKTRPGLVAKLGSLRYHPSAASATTVPRVSLPRAFEACSRNREVARHDAVRVIGLAQSRGGEEEIFASGTMRD